MAFNSPPDISANTATNVNNIDSLIANNRWKSDSEGRYIVTYSFTDNYANDYETGYPNSATHSSSFESLNSTQRTAFKKWVANFESVCGIDLQELTGASDRDATIRVAESSDPTTAYAYLPAKTNEAGDIWYNKTDYNNPVVGDYGNHNLGHELGHALGLEHGHEANGVRTVAMDSNRDSIEYSIMTYRSYVGAATDFYRNETYGYSQSLMMYDIAALQQQYGANYSSNSTDSIYTFSTTTGEMFIDGVGQGAPGANRIFRTIWDGGDQTFMISETLQQTLSWILGPAIMCEVVLF